MRRWVQSFALFAVMLSCSSNLEDPVNLVNTLQGSNSERGFSTGNTYPAVAVPWGMNFWTPQTRANGDGWQYVYTDLKIQGFKQTHQPSPWINDYGCFSVMPQQGEPEYNQKNRAASFKRENEIATPYFYKVELDNGISAEMSASNTGAIFRFCYEGNDDAIVLLDCFPMKGKVAIDINNNKIYGYSNFRASNNNTVLPDNFATHFIVSFDKKISGFGIIQDGKIIENSDNIEGDKVAAFVSFGKQKEVNVKIASSFISLDQAVTNYSRELEGKDLNKIKEEAKRQWNKELSKIKVKGGTEDEQRTFYTAMYRSMLFPRKVHEYDKDGKQIHYGFFDGNVHDGPMYADNGFWDTFRAVHPLFTILKPSMSSEIMEALLNIYREGGWLPEWFSPAYKDCMIGQNSVSVITDALMKGIGSYDKNEMLMAILKCAENEGPNATGREGAKEYSQYGYVPCDAGIGESVSRTLEYAYNDFCISEYAQKTGQADTIVNKYRNRALNYKNVFDQDINFVRPKDSNGAWSDNYSPDMWGPDFTEGSAWHWTWCVFHDPAGLIKLMGGRENFIEMMDSVFVAEPTVGLGKRKEMIHEMKEMIAGNMGQYAHGNQPIQHMVYLYNYAGVPYKTQQKIHEITDKLYHSGISDGKGLCGDEDNGQTSAWYIFSALGFYPVCPGTGEYIIGSPMFGSTEIALENGRKFIVKAKNYSTDNIYIQSAILNGKKFDKSFITHDQIMAGGTLEFMMGPEPNKEWAADSLPFSLSEQNI